MSSKLGILEGQFIVPYWAQDNLLLGNLQPWTSYPKAAVRLYSRAPLFRDDDLKSIQSIEDMDTRPGWLPLSGNLTPKSYRQEMGNLYYKINTGVDNETQYVTLVKGVDTNDIALLEEGSGWEITTGVQGIEQETAVAAVMYLEGSYGGATYNGPTYGTGLYGTTSYGDATDHVNNPVLFISDQGLNSSALVLGGSMYGMTQYDPLIIPTVFTNKRRFVSRVPVRTYSQQDLTYTFTTTLPHNYKVGDLVIMTSWSGSTTSTIHLRVSTVPDPFMFQAPATSPSDFSLIVENQPGTIMNVEKVINDYRPGSMLLDTPSPAYEPNNVAHVWMRPQRMNLLANPQFIGPAGNRYSKASYAGNTYGEGAFLRPFGWRVGKVAKGVAGVIDVSPGSMVVSGEVGTSRTVVESNRFPVRDNKFMSIKMGIRGRGIARVGVVAWDIYYKNPVFIRLPDVELGEDGIDVATLLPTDIYGMLPTLPGAVEYSLRIEWEQIANPNLYGFTLVNPMVDPTDGQDTYFDGDYDDGLEGDYHWHGGEFNQHKHFSMWYNNRKNTEGRLFGGEIEGASYQDGLLTEWTPSTSGVVAHWDAIDGSPVRGWSGDFFYPINDVHTEPVLTGPWQEFNHHLVPYYPEALLDTSGGIVRDQIGDALLVNYGTQTDQVLLDENGNDLIIGYFDSKKIYHADSYLLTS